MRGLHVCLILALLVVPTGLAQTPDTSPPVVFEDTTIQGEIVPLGDPGVAEIPIEIGCDTAENVQTFTTARVTPGKTPEGVNLLITPSSQTWSTAPGDCPAPGETVHTGSVQASVAVNSVVPAYEAVDAPLSMMVTKAPGAAASENRTYGPYEANLTFTPGYFNLYNLRTEEKVQQVRPNQTARFPATIDNMSNHGTVFTMTVTEAPETVNARVEPAELTLEPDGSGSFTVLVDLSLSTSGPVNEVASVEVEVSSHAKGNPEDVGANSSVSTLTKFRRPVTEASGVPGPSLAPLLASLVAAGAVFACARPSDRSLGKR